MNFDKAEPMDIKDMSDEDIHQELKDNDVNMHHKTGSSKLQSTLVSVRAGSYKASEEVKVAEKVETKVTQPTKAALDAKANHQKMTKGQRAMLLTRVVVSPNDPNMSSTPGLIFTVGSSSVNSGRMIKKFVPFNNEQGWHVPQIILDQIEGAQMQKFKEVTMPDGRKQVQPYLAKKFNVQILPPLDKGQMQKLADSQRAKIGIGQ